MKIATILRKDYAGYKVSVRDENHSVVGEHLFTTRMDAENAMALIEAATKRLGGETDVFDNKQERPSSRRKINAVRRVGNAGNA